MADVLGSLLPFALTIAFGPVPIICIAIMLQTTEPRRTSMGFAIGWVIGMVILTIGLDLLSALIPAGSDEHPRFWVGIVQILLGIAMLLLAGKKLLSRPKSAEEAVVPGFLSSLGSTTPNRAILVGSVASAINPKHVVLVFPVGTLIAQHSLSVGQHTIAIAVFVVLSSITVAGVAIGYSFRPDPVGRVVDTGYRWMVRNMAVVSAVVLVLIGINILGKGIGNL